MIKNIIFGVLILGFLASILFLDIPMIQGVLSMKKEEQYQQEQLVQKTDFIGTVEKLMKKYDGNKEILDKLDSILPNNKDVPGLLVQIEALANDGGVILNDVVISISEEKAVSKAQEVRTGEVSQEKTLTDYKVVSIGLKLTANYESFKNFLNAVENNSRLVDVDSIAFSSQAEEGDNIFDFDVVLRTYYQVIN
ncbi:MAG: type 4a pilus biogenesis protein PilO [Patescibacteria group bacterium]